MPLHHDDAHRHFLPFTNWRLESPISYWDPAHHGSIFLWLEFAFAVGSCSFVAWKGKQFPMRILAFGTLTLYLAGIAFAVIMWLPQLTGAQ